MYKYKFASAENALIVQVWNKGREIPKYDPSVWRWDVSGKVMKFCDHGDTSSKHGWEIDHIKPQAKGGETAIHNLQPLQWEVNRTKGDTYPWRP